MKCLVFVLEIKEEDIANGIVDKKMLTKSFKQCIDDLSKHDNVSGETNDHQNSFDSFRVDIESVFQVSVAVTSS